MKYVYPAVFEPEDGLYNVTFPDLPNCYTCGDDLADAMYMAEDALGGWLSRAEENGADIPDASTNKSIALAPDAFVTLILADTDAYRRNHSEKAVKKTLTIPQWLNTAAEKRNINFSQVLQDALRRQLGL
jgi:predicted RNase H-like HicB family nuclease